MLLNLKQYELLTPKTEEVNILCIELIVRLQAMNIFTQYFKRVIVVRKLNKTSDENYKRKNAKTLLLNNYEIQALERYFKKYKITNKSKFMRESIMKVVLKKFSDDYPTLWDQPGVAIQTRISF